jgi:hypothetical protein
MNKYTVEQIVNVMIKKRYPLFNNNSKPYNLNLIGIRCTSNKNSNTFNDLFNLLEPTNDGFNLLMQCPMTTDPGTYYRLHPMNVKGTGIMKPGHYKGLWTFGKHNDKYEALVQVGYCTLIRDNDKNNDLNINSKIEESVNNAGINLHHAGKSSKLVDNWSAGCQVFANINDFNKFMKYAHKSADNYGDKFSYTLLLESDFS